jgi:hypothetical protein
MITKHRLAGIISVFLDPLVEGPLLLAILFLTKSMAPVWVLALVILVDTLVPVFFLGYGLKKGFISDWETSKRRERHKLNFLCLLITLANLFLFYLFGDLFLLRLFLVFLVLMAFYTLITFFWKISGHMTANTAFYLALNIFFGWRFWWLLFLLPVVAWARLVRNRHNVWQILGGVALSSLVVSCGAFSLF